MQFSECIKLSGINMGVAKQSAAFTSPSGVPPLAAVKMYFRRAMKIPKMCLVLKLDNGKVVYIAHEQTDRHTDRRTDTPSTVLVYRCIYSIFAYMLFV